MNLLTFISLNKDWTSVDNSTVCSSSCWRRCKLVDIWSFSDLSSFVVLFRCWICSCWSCISLRFNSILLETTRKHIHTVAKVRIQKILRRASFHFYSSTEFAKAQLPWVPPTARNMLQNPSWSPMSEGHRVGMTKKSSSDIHYSKSPIVPTLLCKSKETSETLRKKSEYTVNWKKDSSFST